MNFTTPEVLLVLTSGKFTSHPSSLPASLPTIQCVRLLTSGVRLVRCFVAICSIKASEPTCVALRFPSAVQNRQPPGRHLCVHAAFVIDARCESGRRQTVCWPTSRDQYPADQRGHLQEVGEVVGSWCSACPSKTSMLPCCSSSIWICSYRRSDT